MNCELCSIDSQSGETRCRRCGFDTTLPPDVKRFLTSLTGFRPGELLDGRYRIDRILGYGGMSVVYKAHDDVLGEDVAIKVINGGRVSDGAKLFTDIRRDIVTTRKLAHPDIVKVHDFHKTDSCGFLTMEYVQGRDLASLIAERGKLDEKEVCRLAVLVAEALSYAHLNGVVHCDIKPGNLLLTENGRVKIADFGISRVMQDENTGLTGLVVGTPAYMSPEQIRGERPTPLADMYALAIVMWHCLMGAPPYTRGDVAYQHVHVALPPMEGVSPELERIVCKAASKAAADRYPSLDVMALELHRFLMRQSDATIVQTRPPDPAATIVQTAPPLTAATVLQTPPAPPTPAVAPAPSVQPAAAQAQVSPTSPPSPPPPEPAAGGAPGSGEPVTGAPVTGPPPAGGVPGGGGPPADGPAAGMAHPSPVPAPAQGNKRMAIAAAAVLLGAAVIWGLIPRSRTEPGGGQGAPVVKDLPAAAPTATVAGPAEGAGKRAVVSRSGIPAPQARPARRPGEVTPVAQAAPESPRAVVPDTRSNPVQEKCSRAACFEFSGALLTPAVAQSGQTVRCTARFSFRHNEGGTAPLEVEQAAQLGVRSGRSVSRRMKIGQGMNDFEVSFKVPDRTSPGTYPVTLSVRRRSITESVKLNLVVTR